MDPATIFAYMLVAIMLFVVWWQRREANKDRKKQGEGETDRSRHEWTEPDEEQPPGEVDESETK